jgi:hypothetical protein
VQRRDGLSFISTRRANYIQKGSNGIKFGGTSYREITKREWTVFNVVENISFIHAISRT